ncbi:hypothetical protein QS609_24780 [Escherichia coli]|nr:hypothetical protein [Escherichia coli]
MGSCAAPSAKGDDKFITTDYLQQCRLKEIAAKTGLTASTVQYIVYVKSKNKPYATTEYVSFETENAVHYRVQKEFVDTERSLLDNISDNTRFRELYLTDGTFYCARNIKYEVFISE